MDDVRIDIFVPNNRMEKVETGMESIQAILKDIQTSLAFNQNDGV